jgi:hypothetical protein
MIPSGLPQSTYEPEHSFLERYAEWISVGAVAAGLFAIAIGRMQLWVLLASGGVMVFGVILQLTRPLRCDQDLGAVFRLAYAFALVIGLGAPIGLVFLNRPFLTADPIEDCLKGQVAGETASKPECEATERALHRRSAALAILPGCDFAEDRFRRDHSSDKSGQDHGNDKSSATHDDYCDLLPPQWVISLGGHVLQCHVEGNCEEALPADVDFAPKLITGGLVVPVYFVVLTLLGALVSMVRRLPEFQHRSSECYPAEYATTVVETGSEPRPPLSLGQARDYVVFQMIQVASAPVIGVVAYAWAEPRQIASTTLLAFAAGFSSDVFLLAIRNLAERFVKADLPSVRPEKVSVSPVASPRAPLAVGDRVRLTQPIGPFRAGDSATVLEVAANGAVTVRVDRAVDAQAQVPSVLEPQDPTAFARDEAPPAADEGPVG